MGQIALSLKFHIWTVDKQMTCKTESLEIELFNHSTVCQQMTDV